MRLRGLQGPLQRGDADFVVLEGDEYVNNRLETILSIHSNPFDGTGELEWDQGVGVMTEFLRHRNVTRGRLEVVTMHAVEVLRRVEPDLVFTKVLYLRDPTRNIVRLEIGWDHKRLEKTGTAKVEVVT